MATVVNVSKRSASSGPDWARRYPPLITIGLAVILAAVVLPSALNQPQANPTSTPELAPVTGQSSDAPQGNLASLGLGRSTGIEGSGALGDGGGVDDDLPPAGDGVQGRGKTVKTKRCVGKPPRQTEDPLSPPCVASFDGDNGGKTYQGVTNDEIRIVMYHDGGSVHFPTARGADNPPSSALIDLDDPPTDDETGVEIVTREWARYFEERYQTYGRRPHFYIYWSSPFPYTAETRQADAANVYGKVKPFATISYTGLGGAGEEYLKFMASKGVLNFGSAAGRSNNFFQQFPKLIWGYPPTVEIMARHYVEFVCKKVVNKPVSFAGPGIAAGPRKLAMVHTSDVNWPTLPLLADRVKEGVEACGGKIVDTKTYPKNGYTVDSETLPAFATQNMASLQSQGVTTILWPGGVEIKQSQAAGQLNYFPEWVTLGDGQMEASSYAQKQDPNVWDEHAWTVTPTVRVETRTKELCYQAYREADQQAADLDVIQFACPQYDDLRQLFTGIQVAGPKLGPFSIDKGFHAIPAIDSPDPHVPACYYEPGDYTCAKDAEAMWFDAQGVPPNNPGATGCWRMANAGRRYRFGFWPDGDVLNLKSADPNVAPCNGYDTVENINNTPPGG
jgi:hypothetical protein